MDEGRQIGTAGVPRTKSTLISKSPIPFPLFPLKGFLAGLPFSLTLRRNSSVWIRDGIGPMLDVTRFSLLESVDARERLVIQGFLTGVWARRAKVEDTSCCSEIFLGTNTGASLFRRVGVAGKLVLLFAGEALFGVGVGCSTSPSLSEVSPTKELSI